MAQQVRFEARPSVTAAQTRWNYVGTPERRKGKHSVTHRGRGRSER